MAEHTYLAVKNFQHYQHYKDRNPLWIKLYNAVMDDEAFIALSDGARGHLMLIWLLASRRGNRIPHDPKLVRQAIQAKGKVDLDGLVAAGFLTVVSASDVLAESGEPASDPLAETGNPASKPLADADDPASTRARPRARGEREESREERDTSSSTRDVLFDRLASPTDRLAARDLLDAVDVPAPWIAEMAASLDQMPGHHPVTPVQLGRAVRDYIANGAAKRPSLRQFRRYLEQAGSEHPRRAGAKAKGAGPGEKSYANATAALEGLE